MVKSLEAYTPPKDGSGPLFVDCVAESLGKRISADRIADLIQASNQQGIIFHGIRNPLLIPKVDEEGILPLTPEGGFISCWSMGETLFGTRTTTGINTFDSTFFHYAPNNGIAYGTEPSMNIAVTKLALVEPGRQASPNQQVWINRPVNRSDLALLTVKGKRGKRKLDERMFDLLEVVAREFSPGSTLQSLQ